MYLGDDAALPEWEEWFGRKVDFYSVLVQRSAWEDYRVQNMPLELSIERLGKGRTLVITFSLFPIGESDLSAVAAGEHDERFRRFGRDLVESGQSDTRLRFGAEMNGDWSHDGAVGRPETYVRAWRRVARVLDSVEGGRFRYIWAPAFGQADLAAPKAYPGDDVVDLVGLTFYDRDWRYYPFEEGCGSMCKNRQRRLHWERLVNAEFGLDFWAQFAREHGKRLVFPEYGIMPANQSIQGGGDNPAFFRWFDGWLRSHSDVTAWHNTWSFVAGPGYIGPEELLATNEFPPNPDASAAFRRLFA